MTRLLSISVFLTVLVASLGALAQTAPSDDYAALTKLPALAPITTPPEAPLTFKTPTSHPQDDLAAPLRALLAVFGLGLIAAGVLLYRAGSKPVVVPPPPSTAQAWPEMKTEGGAQG